MTKMMIVAKKRGKKRINGMITLKYYNKIVMMSMITIMILIVNCLFDDHYRLWLLAEVIWCFSFPKLIKSSYDSFIGNEYSFIARSTDILAKKI